MIKYLPIFLLLLFSSCEKDVAQKSTVLRELYFQFKNGEIVQAEYKGEIVYVTSLNLFDADTSIYDQHGNIIGGCNYAYSLLDPICHELSEIKEIYRCKKHVTGKPAVDFYRLTSSN